MTGKAVILTVLMLVAGTAHAQLLTPTQPAATSVAPHVFRDVLIRLKAAVQKDDRRAVASLVIFPMAINKGKRNGSTYVPSVSVFVVNYSTVFSREVRLAILSQNPDSFVIRDGFARVGRGELTLGTRCQSAAPSSCETGVTSVNYIEKE